MSETVVEVMLLMCRGCQSMSATSLIRCSGTPRTRSVSRPECVENVFTRCHPGSCEEGQIK